MYICVFPYIDIFSSVQDNERHNNNSLTKNPEYGMRVCQSGMTGNVSVYVA